MCEGAVGFGLQLQGCLLPGARPGFGPTIPCRGPLRLTRLLPIDRGRPSSPGVRCTRSNVRRRCLVRPRWPAATDLADRGLVRRNQGPGKLRLRVVGLPPRGIPHSGCVAFGDLPGLALGLGLFLRLLGRALLSPVPSWQSPSVVLVRGWFCLVSEPLRAGLWQSGCVAFGVSYRCCAAP